LICQQNSRPACKFELAARAFLAFQHLAPPLLSFERLLSFI
jgi:hypothetical protein